LQENTAKFTKGRIRGGSVGKAKEQNASPISEYNDFTSIVAQKFEKF
jgi:hypothetical protein